MNLIRVTKLDEILNIKVNKKIKQILKQFEEKWKLQNNLHSKLIQNLGLYIIELNELDPAFFALATLFKND